MAKRRIMVDSASLKDYQKRAEDFRPYDEDGNFVVDEKLNKFIDYVAMGMKKLGAFTASYDMTGLSEERIKYRMRMLNVKEVNDLIEARKQELIRESMDVEAIAGLETAREVTKDRLISEAEFAMRKSKACVARQVDGIGVINKAASDIYLRSIDQLAKLIGAYAVEEKIDNEVQIILDDETQELSK